MSEQQINSVLAVDFGSTHTRIVLIDVVDGTYRLVARGETRTTDSYPANDLNVGFQRVLRLVNDATGRRFLDADGALIIPEKADRSGADLVAVTASMGRPLRVVLIGLTADVSINSAMHAVAGTYMDIGATISLEDGRDEEERLNAIMLSYPDVIFITGGTDQGAARAVLRLAEVAALAVGLIDRQRRPPVIFSGNSTLAEDILLMFEGLTEVLITDNVRPDLESERLDSARLNLGRAFDRYAALHSDALAALSSTSSTGILPSTQSPVVLADYLGQTGITPVAILDVGSSVTTLAISHEGEMYTAVRPQIGMGYSMAALLDYVGIDAVRDWLPFNISKAELTTYVTNKTLRPAGIPATRRDSNIEHALLKAGVRAMLTEMNPFWRQSAPAFATLIATGATLSATGTPGYSALLLLDIFQPRGITRLKTDPYGLIPAMGAIATRAPEIVVQLMDGRGLDDLGVCISVDGKARLDKPALTIGITPDEGDPVEYTVDGGHLWTYPLLPGREAEIVIKCHGGASVNGKGRIKLTVTGGMVGIIVDARGRALALPDDVKERAAQIPLWMHEITGDPLLDIELNWLEDVVELATDEDEEEAKPARRGLFRRGGRQKAQKTGKGRSGAAAGSDVTDEDLDALFGDKSDKKKSTRIEDEINELRDVLS